MPNVARSTLTEVHRKLSEICFTILSLYDETRWKRQQQIIYSTVASWETASEAYMIQTRENNVSFPFASLTRDTSQETYKLWNKGMIGHNPINPQESSVKIVEVKPTRAIFILSIYDQKFEDIETLADIFISQGQEVQRFDYYSDILEDTSRFSFNFNEPIHEMIADKAEKRKGKGIIYGINIPIVVDCILGIKAEHKIIKEAILRILNRVHEPLPDDITQEEGVEIESIDENS